jgi:FkbM family methyltransferase
MSFPSRPIAYVLAASNHGSMIVNRNDYQATGPTRGHGVGLQILCNSCYDQNDLELTLGVLNYRRKHFGDGVVAIDGGANIGVFSIEWGRHMYGWGRVMSFEAQEVVYYALAGNIALNNCLNVRARLAALGETCGELAVPQPNYFRPSSFGSLELRPSADPESIGQPVSYAPEACSMVPVVTLDSLALDRLDLVKIDVEGMELEVLRGGQSILARHHPVLYVEVAKSDRVAIGDLLGALGYRVIEAGSMNILAEYVNDPSLE